MHSLLPCAARRCCAGRAGPHLLEVDDAGGQAGQVAPAVGREFGVAAGGGGKGGRNTTGQRGHQQGGRSSGGGGGTCMAQERTEQVCLPAAMNVNLLVAAQELEQEPLLLGWGRKWQTVTNSLAAAAPQQQPQGHPETEGTVAHTADAACKPRFTPRRPAGSGSPPSAAAAPKPPRRAPASGRGT